LTDEIYIKRCIDLALSSAGRVGLNPNVGAVLVHDGRIIGEGVYEYFGGPHAEVNAIASVSEEDRPLMKESTMYVSLEPCNFYGKTPPCSERILKHQIPRLVVGCEDPNPKIAGSSIAHLRSNGVDVHISALKEECKQVIEPFKVNILNNRPFITIKFAQSNDLYMGKKGKQVWISNPLSKQWSHKLRSENHAILIGTNTALVDDPSLSNRLWSGDNPLRIVLDKENKIPSKSQLLSDDLPLIIVNENSRAGLKNVKTQWTMPMDLTTLMERLYKEKDVGRLIVEGGAATIKSFKREGLWDRACVITSPKLLESGIKAPNLNGRLISCLDIGEDQLKIFSKE